MYRTRKPLHNRHITTLPFGMVKPVYVDFSLPGDIWKIKANCLIRCQPMLSPSLTQYDAYFRFFYVPLRLVLDKCEEIITGSKDGSLIEGELPKAANFIKEWLTVHGTPSASADHCTVHRDSFWAALGVRPTKMYVHGTSTPTVYEYQNYDAEVDEDDMGAAYFYRAYCLIIWHYFRDENYQSFDGDFEKFYEYMLCNKGVSDVRTNGWYVDDMNGTYNYLYGQSTVEQYGCTNFKLWWSNLSRDYFMDVLPWIMKGTEPTINSIMHADFTSAVDSSTDGRIVGLGNSNKLGVFADGNAHSNLNITSANILYDSSSAVPISSSSYLISALNSNQITDGGFTESDLRDLRAETRIFERLAQRGSRYVEYLNANFGIAPADDTLQRPVYLGGFTQPIVTTEVVQNGGTTTEVGTLRGHGISNGGNSIRPYVSKEFGIIMGFMYIKPRTQYLFQMKRKYTYKSRFDFFNPSLQLLSEQQTRSLEFFMPRPVINNFDTDPAVFKKIPRFTFGYNHMYEELRKDTDLITGEMADTLSYWTSAINPAVNASGFEITTTPPMNGHNMNIGAYLYTLNRPWSVTAPSYRPFIVDFGISGSVFRPIVKNPVPR